MPYQTVSIKLLRPGAAKRRMLDEAGDRYTRAFHLLLETVAPHLPGGPVRRSQAMKCFTREVTEPINALDAQPFKDALKMDLSMYLALGKRGEQLPSPGEEALWEAVNGEERLTRGGLDYLLGRCGKLRPILFSRCDTGRDYALLRDRDTGRYYAKVYLFNRKHAIPYSGNASGRLYYIAQPEETLEPMAKVRYLLLPLDAGDWQKQYLAAVEAGHFQAKSALLLHRGGDYYLNVHIWSPPPEPVKTVNYLGIVRGTGPVLHYGVCDGEGDFLEAGTLPENYDGTKGSLCALANEAVSLGIGHRSTVILENLVGTGDDLYLDRESAGFPMRAYNRFSEVLTYKAELAGLPPPVRVSARRLYQRCPVCGEAKKANRYNKDSLLCVSCGAYRPVTHAAAWNLAATLIRYQQTRLEVEYAILRDQVVFRLKALGIVYRCAQNQFSVDSFCSYLQGEIERPRQNPTTAQRSMLKKLRTARDVEDCLQFVRVD